MEHDGPPGKNGSVPLHAGLLGWWGGEEERGCHWREGAAEVECLQRPMRCGSRLLHAWIMMDGGMQRGWETPSRLECEASQAGLNTRVVRWGGSETLPPPRLVLVVVPLEKSTPEYNC